MIQQQSPKKAVRSPVKQQQPTTPVKKQEAHEQVTEEKVAAPSTPPPTTKQEDVDMEDADSKPAATVPFTPSKPIEQMTVAVLREELKHRGLSIKGLKAELVQRLKDATGA